MNILILTDYISYGGVATASENLQKCLNSDDINVKRYSIYKTQENLMGRFFCILKSIYYLYSNNFDRVILTHFEAIFIGLLCRPFMAKDIFINVVHTDLYGYYSNAPYTKKIIIRIMFWLLKNKPIVFDSKESNLKAKSYFGLTNSRSIYNVVATPQTRSPKLKNSAFKFGSVSRLHSGKNIDLLIRVFNSFWLDNKDTELLIFGDGPELNRLKEYLLMFPCSGAVSFEGYVNHPDEIYSQIDSLVGFSNMEGFGLVILEALVRNIPVLYSDCSCGPREILKPDSDPCHKTNKYEIGRGGVLVTPPKINCHYANCLLDSDVIALEALRLLYKEFDAIKMDSFVDLEIFGSLAIKQQWTDFLFDK